LAYVIQKISGSPCDSVPLRALQLHSNVMVMKKSSKKKKPPTANGGGKRPLQETVTTLES
jgi:hypothetical protein